MKPAYVYLILIALTGGLHAQAPPPREFALKAESPAFNNLIAGDARLEKVAGGFGFTEGPVWDEKGFLYVSDEQQNKLSRVYPDGRVETVLEIRDPDGNTFDKNHRLISCLSTLRKVIAVQPDGQYKVLAEQFEGKKLNSPNDVVLGPDGALYFTDPTLDLPKGETQELPYKGVFRMADDGSLRLLTTDLDQPNGLAFSPDGKRLYVDDSRRREIRVYDVGPDGSLSNGRLFGKEEGGPREGVPDGMRVDVDGNLYVTGPLGVWVWSPDGTLLGKIVMPEQPANLAWGDSDYGTLYFTAKTSVYRLRTKTRGFVPPETSFRWIAPSSGELAVNGLPWYSNKSDVMMRLPENMEQVFRPPVWNLAKSPSGGRIRFRSNSNLIAVRLEYPSPPEMTNMHAFGQTGVDLYVDGVYIASAIAQKESGPGKIVERTLLDLKDRPRKEREITLYLPLYKPVKVLSVGVEESAKISPATPFALPKPVVFYGTSITQGGCASRSGMSYQAILGRMLNIDFVNLGFSGNGKGEPEVARVVSDIDASCFVLDFAQNNGTVESLQQVYAPFMETLRAKHPETPIVAITPIYASREAVTEPGKSELQKMRDHIRQVVSQRISQGDKRLQLIEGTDLLGPAQGDGLVDGTHPNDLGFQWMAEGLAARLRQVLALR